MEIVNQVSTLPAELYKEIPPCVAVGAFKRRRPFRDTTAFDAERPEAPKGAAGETGHSAATNMALLTELADKVKYEAANTARKRAVLVEIFSHGFLHGRYARAAAVPRPMFQGP